MTPPRMASFDGERLRDALGEAVIGYMAGFAERRGDLLRVPAKPRRTGTRSTPTRRPKRTGSMIDLTATPTA
jgi:hypothetical protein